MDLSKECRGMTREQCLRYKIRTGNQARKLVIIRGYLRDHTLSKKKIHDALVKELASKLRINFATSWSE